MGFLGLYGISFPILGKFLTIISSNIFSYPFYLSSSSGTSIIQMLMCLILLQLSLRLSSFLFILFSLFYCFSYFHHFIFLLTYPFFCLNYFCSWFPLMYFSSQLLCFSLLIMCSLFLLGTY